MAAMDKRIAELQQRLRNRKQQQQLQQQPVAAVEPLPSQSESNLNKQDPKYQTLPYSIKFPEKKDPESPTTEEDMAYKGVLTQPVGSQVVAPNRGSSSHIISNFAPRPYGYNKKADDSSRLGVTSPSVVSQPNAFPKTSTPIISSATQPKPSAHSANVARERERFISGGPPPPPTSVPSNTSNNASSSTKAVHSPQRPANPPSYQAATSRHPLTMQPRSSQDYAPYAFPARTQPNESNGFVEGTTSFGADGASTPPATPPGGTKADTSPPAVSSALSVLMSSGSTTTTTTSPSSSSPNAKTYRYAPKSVIANTYMRKLGSNALEQYRKNMSALYSGLSPIKSPEAKESPTATVHPMNHQAPSDPAASNGLYDLPALPYNIDPERARLAYPTRPNAPRPLRRRLSSGEIPQAGEFHRNFNHPSHQPPLSPVRSPSLEDDVFHRPPFEQNNNKMDSKLEDPYVPSKGPSSPVEEIPYADSPEAEPNEGEPPVEQPQVPIVPLKPSASLLQKKKGNLKKQGSMRNVKLRVTFDPLALLLDASLEGELDLVMKSAEQVSLLV